MDAFKILTRSTRLKASALSSKSTDAQIPSRGEAADPQLFRDRETREIPDTSRRQVGEKKRKRDVMELDYFSSPSQTQGASQQGRKRPADLENGGAVVGGPEEDLSSEEYRRILQAHKVKITDLSHASLSLDKRLTDKSEKRKRKKDVARQSSRKKDREMRRIYPTPLTSFEQLRTRYKISKRLYENIRDQGFTVPTEVQLGSLPLLLADPKGGLKHSEELPAPKSGISNINLLSVAPTGSGKTLSFLIPVLNDIIIHRRLIHDDDEHLYCLVIVPTKELVIQIVNEGRKLVKGTGVRISAMRKGMKLGSLDNSKSLIMEDGSPNPDHEDHQVKCNVLVSTPLSLVNTLSTNQTQDMRFLPSVRYLVLDEADVLLDPLFREQTLEVWKACNNKELRVGLWSATMGSNVEELAKSTIESRQNELDILQQTPLLRLVVGLKDSAVPNIEHRLVYAATEQGKLLGLRQLLHPTSGVTAEVNHLRPPFLVFTQTIPRAVALHSELLYDIPPEAGGSGRIAVLHSDLSETMRSDVMTQFRKGEVWVIITTDLLARGVDFRGINGVVNYDIPNTSSAYVHRVGRTGRAGREGGVAVTFYTKEDIPYVRNIANVIAASEKSRGKPKDSGVQKWLLDALPKPSKKAKKELKLKGVSTRRRQSRDISAGKGNTKVRISTKSGYDRKMENNRKGAIRSSQRRASVGSMDDSNDGGSDVWEGLDN